jgi:cellulose synthase (UDP-forming)
MAALTLLCIVYAWELYLSGGSRYTIGGVMINTFWGMHNMIALYVLIYASFWKPAS